MSDKNNSQTRQGIGPKVRWLGGFLLGLSLLSLLGWGLLRWRPQGTEMLTNRVDQGSTLQCSLSGAKEHVVFGQGEPASLRLPSGNTLFLWLRGSPIDQNKVRWLPLDIELQGSHGEILSSFSQTLREDTVAYLGGSSTGQDNIALRCSSLR
jgi:hypothetical protein